MCTRVPGIAQALPGVVYSICLLQFIPNANKRDWSQWSWDHDKADDVRSDASNPSYSIVSWVCKRLPLLDPDAWFRLGLRSKILFRFPVLNEHQLYHNFVWATHLSIRKSSFLQRTNYKLLSKIKNNSPKTVFKNPASVYIMDKRCSLSSFLCSMLHKTGEKYSLG